MQNRVTNTIFDNKLFTGIKNSSISRFYLYVLDKSSYSIICVIEEVDRLLMVSADRFLFFMSQPEKQRDNVYIIQNIQLNKSTPPDSNAYCKFKNNPLASYHLLSNPFLLPCGCFGCLECILHDYNLFKQTLI